MYGNDAPWLVEFSCQVYSRLLSVLPGRLRGPYAEPMAQAFRDLSRDAWRERGARGLIGVWRQALVDLLAGACIEWLSLLQSQVLANIRFATRSVATATALVAALLLYGMTASGHVALLAPLAAAALAGLLLFGLLGSLQWKAPRQVSRTGSGEGILVLTALRPVQAAFVAIVVAASLSTLAILLHETVHPELAPVPAQLPAARLLLTANESSGVPSAVPLLPIDPDSLASVPGVSPLSDSGCSGGTVVSPSGKLAAMVAGGTFLGTPASGCQGQPNFSLQVFDLESWSVRSVIPLNHDESQGYELLPAAIGAFPPIRWSPDGRRLFVLTTSQPTHWSPDAHETRELWIIDPTGVTPAKVVSLELAPWRLDVAPDGSTLYMLAYATNGSARFGPSVAGSAVLLMLDPATGAERSRVDLPELVIGQKGSQAQPVGGPVWDGGVVPGVAISPDGTRYFVAHADAPVLDVIDIHLQGSERLERRVQTDGFSVPAGFPPFASVTVSPDATYVYVHRAVDDAAVESGIRVVDTHNWQVTTFDQVATGVVFSPDGRWMYVQEPRLARRPGAPWDSDRLDVRQAQGARVRVVDAATGQDVASLLQNRAPLQLVAYGSDRLYAVVPGPDFPAPVAAIMPAVAVANDRTVVDLVAYEVGTWRELARRSSSFQQWLEGSPSMLGDPFPY